eukprot:1482527-Rhodomonas_salina.8
MLRCLSPAGEAGRVAIDVSSNAADFSKSRVSLELKEPASIDRLHPSHGPETGGTPIQIFGSHFYISESAILCQFAGTSETVGELISSSHIQCVSPGGLGLGIAGVSVSFNGQVDCPFSTRRALRVRHTESGTDIAYVDTRTSQGST